MQKLDPESQRRFAVEVLERLRASGFDAYWAGGCVRDSLLGLLPKDYDVATSATPDQVRGLFGKRRTLAVGASFGVIVVLGPRSAGPVEVTTFRRDAAYSDGRHPDSVTFSTAEQDAQRRDFTINGLFYDPLQHEVIDYVEGQRDLEQKVVRAIGDPRARLAEDKLRMLRAVRFSAAFDFRLDEATRDAIRHMAGDITKVSAERIAQEMRHMLTGASRVRALALLLDCGLLAAVLPELLTLGDLASGSTSQPGATHWDETLALLGCLHEPTFALALAALLHAVGRSAGEDGSPVGPDDPVHVAERSAEVAEGVCRRWRLSKKDTERTTWLIMHQGALRDARRLRWSQLQRVLVSGGIDELIELHEAAALATGGDTDDVAYCREQLERPAEELNPKPLVVGVDLIVHGVPRGKIYAMLLERVRDAQLDDEIHTKEDALALVDRLLEEHRRA